jgi:hypothetical protein
MSAAIESAPPLPGPSGAAALDWVLETLWRVPGGAHASAAGLPGSAHATDTFAVLPSAAHPRLLVPLHSRKAASHALREYTPGKTSVRLAKPLLTLGLRSGLARPLLRDRVYVGVSEDVPAGAWSQVLIKEHLREVLGRRDLELAVKFDAPRPQRKPILHILDRAGRPVGFGKVGWNDLTRALIRNEARMLEFLGQRPHPPREFDVPRLLYAGPWRELELLIVAPVSFGARRRFLASPPVAAVHEVGDLSAAGRAPLGHSEFWRRTRRRIAATALSAAGGRPRLEAPAQAIEDRYGDTGLAFGSWHGDFVPWNMGRRAGRLYVWDWEWSGLLAPRGLDGIHFDYQAELGLRKTAPVAALGATLARSRGLLEALDVDAVHGPLLLGLHLLEMALRFDEARAAGVDTADPKYLRALEHHLTHTLL